MANEDSLLHKQRHSLAHIMVQAQQRLLDPELILGVGPAIDNGFYHDFLWSDKADQELIKTEESIMKTTIKEMQKIVKENQDFVYLEMPAKDAQEMLKLLGQPYTLELCNDLIVWWETVLGVYINTVNAQAVERMLAHTKPEYLAKYKNITEWFTKHYPASIEWKFVTFANMCKWPHVENTKEINPDSFTLEKLAWAYRKWDSDNIMMTRIYGLVFESKDELKAYQTMMEEAKKRDHRILGAKLKIFTLSPLVWAGLPLLQPNGMLIRKEVEDYLWELHKDKGYQRVWTPHLAKEDLYKTSGHAEKFGDELFRVQGKEEKFIMKPMNCPHHMQIFADNQFSYRDMPVRYFEPATVYRDEKSGQLSGLTRVRAITQDDGHLFCRASQIGEEVGSIVNIIKEFYSTLGMINDYRVRLSIRGPEGKYLGSDEVWVQAEEALRKASEENELPFRVGVGEAAFYGPKLDFMFKDAIGREWQLATIQCDFNLPERFDLSFVNEQGEKERPVVIHRAISGSLERFMGVMIEHFSGAFPLWLAPVQIQIVPVAEKFNDYAFDLRSQIYKAGLRIRVDDGDDSFSKKIRNAELMKVPYMLIVGEKEESDNSVSVRVYKTKEQLTMSVTDFIAEKVKEYKERSL